MRTLVLVLIALGAGACLGGSAKGTQASMDAGADVRGDANTSTCTGESNADLCQLAGLACGAAVRVDRCGDQRTIDCGVCIGEACAAGQVTQVTCGLSDPCHWSGDGHCDVECQQAFPNSHFNDAKDCLTIGTSLGTSCSINSDCAAGLTCSDNICGCCNVAHEVEGLWQCNATLVPAIAEGSCGTRANHVAHKSGQEALASVGIGCHSNAPDNYFCPPELQCVARVEADEFRCGCCAEVQGSFMCSYNVEFARTFCLGLSTGCLDGSCLPCIGSDCEPECASTNNGVCDEPEGTGLCPNGSDFSDCGP